MTDGGKNNDRYRGCWARYQVIGRPEHCGNDWCDHRGVQAILRWQTRDYREGYALRQNNYGAGKTGSEVRLDGFQVDHARPTQERKYWCQFIDINHCTWASKSLPIDTRFSLPPGLNG